MTTPLDGMQFLLCREADTLRTKTTKGPCCRNLAYYRNGKLWCMDCKRPRGRLPPKVIAGLLAVFNAFPGIKDETHVLRDKSDLPDEIEQEATDTLAGDTGASALPENEQTPS
jgi:hypothetical protein